MAQTFNKLLFPFPWQLILYFVFIRISFRSLTSRNSASKFPQAAILRVRHNGTSRYEPEAVLAGDEITKRIRRVWLVYRLLILRLLPSSPGDLRWITFNLRLSLWVYRSSSCSLFRFSFKLTEQPHWYAVCRHWSKCFYKTYIGVQRSQRSEKCFWG